MVHQDNISKSNLELLLRNTSTIRWSQPQIFEAVHDTVKPTLKKILLEKKVHIISEAIFLQLWLPTEKAKNMLLEK